MFRKFVSTTSLLLGLSIITSCSSVTNNSFITGQEQTKISSFESSSLNGLLLGSFSNTSIFLKNDSETAFKSEKEAINYVLKKQSGISLIGDKSYAVVQKNNLFYVYQLSAKNIKSYADLRSISLNKKAEIKLNSIISENGKVRFYSYDASSITYSTTNQPAEIINRLKYMEEGSAKAKDARGIFATEYRVVSQRVEKEINNYKAKGETKSAAFLQSLMINFANKYFHSHDLYFSDNLQKADEVWRMAFDSGRKSDIVGLDKSANIGEVLALSMTAHILHDLSLSLKDINYTPKDAELKQVFFKFNSVLFEEKNNILNAINKIYGKNVISSANNFFGSVGDFTMQKIFNLMRNTAENQSEFSDKAKIIKKTITVGDAIMKAVPGGNSLNN